MDEEGALVDSAILEESEKLSTIATELVAQLTGEMWDAFKAEAVGEVLKDCKEILTSNIDYTKNLSQIYCALSGTEKLELVDDYVAVLNNLKRGITAIDNLRQMGNEVENNGEINMCNLSDAMISFVDFHYNNRILFDKYFGNFTEKELKDRKKCGNVRHLP